MARATRAKPAPKEPTPEPTPATTKPLPAPTSNPPKLFVLPKDTSSDARIVTLDNPATDTPSRYYFCPSKGFYEFTRIAAPKKACRSWLITSQAAKTTQGEASQQQDEDGKEKDDETETGLGSGFIAQDASLFLATPIDLLFLILPALAPKSAKDSKQHFLALDDYTDKLASSSRHWRTLLSQYPSVKTMLEKKMRQLCDTVDAGDETMYRISTSKLQAVLVAKAERMVKRGLPASIEEKFVKSALDVPVMSIRREESTLSAVSASDPAAVDSQTSPSAEASQATTNLTTPDDATTTTVEDEEPTKPTLHTPDTIPHLLRLRTALSYLASSYLPRTLAPFLLPATPSPTTTLPDFTPLTTHLAALSALKSEAAALRSISDNISRKRGGMEGEDEEKIAEREEKKRKREDEERRKKSESLGVKRLRKVDTSGMQKMSAFFAAVPKKQKKM